MTGRVFSIAIVLVLAAPAVLSCKGREHTFRYKDEQVDEEPTVLGSHVPQVRFHEELLESPAQGTAGARASTLWDATVSRIEADLAAGLEDEEYLERRDPILMEWFALYFEHQTAFQQAGLESSEIVGVINHVYGFSAEPERQAEREEARRDRAALDSQLRTIGEKIKKID